jgi:hypothetical protein
MRRSLLECLFPTLRVSAVIPSDEFIQLHAAVSTDLSLNSSFRDSPDDYQNRSLYQRSKEVCHGCGY